MINLERKDIEEQVIHALKKTKESGREHGLTFCEGLKVGNFSDGSKSSVHTGKCPNSKVIGVLHTHTFLTSTEDILPSPSDTINGIKLKFFCIAGFKENNGIVRCFEGNNIERELHNIIKAKKGIVNDENLQTASRLMIGYMLKEKGYLEKHSFKKSLAII